MNLFTPENTRRFSQSELDDLNAQWEQIVEENGLEEGTAWYMDALNDFMIEIKMDKTI